MSNYKIQNGELYHFGVKGMKWGKRKANPYATRLVRGHAGPGNYLTKKRQLEGDKRDLEKLNRGEHLSVGLTKKRQAVYDARDRKAIEKRIAKNEASSKKISPKKAKQAAANALDKLDDVMFFKGDNIPNNFAIRAGIRTVSDKLKNNESFMNAAVSGLEDYRFFKD